MRTTHDHRNVKLFLHARGNFEHLTVVGCEERRDTDDVGPNFSYISFDLIERLSEVIVSMKSRKWRLVRYRVVVGEITELLGNRYRPSAASGVVILDDNFNFGQMLFDCGFEITESDRLQPNVCVIKVLDRRLD